MDESVGFDPEEVRTGEPTRSARLKWVIIVDEDLPPGRAVNAAVCVAAATSPAVSGLLGPDGKDATGSAHPGLPWAGCSILAAPPERLAAIRSAAADSLGVYVADMPAAAQTTRVYDEYLTELSTTTPEAFAPLALSLVGPRSTIDSLVKKLRLL